MLRSTMLVLASAVLIAGASAPGSAAACRDAKGKFIKCPPKAAVVAPAKGARCRDAKGHFAKCGTPGAKPS